MREVKVNKNALLNTVKDNRGRHEAEYKQAMVGYRQEVIEGLQKALDEAQSGGELKTSLWLSEPISEVKSYEKVIAMLEMSTDEEVTLSQSEFSQYVLDDWTWKELASTTNARYIK